MTIAEVTYFHSVILEMKLRWAGLALVASPTEPCHQHSKDTLYCTSNMRIEKSNSKNNKRQKVRVQPLKSYQLELVHFLVNFSSNYIATRRNTKGWSVYTVRSKGNANSLNPQKAVHTFKHDFNTDYRM